MSRKNRERSKRRSRFLFASIVGWPLQDGWCPLGRGIAGTAAARRFGRLRRSLRRFCGLGRFCRRLCFLCRFCRLFSGLRCLCGFLRFLRRFGGFRCFFGVGGWLCRFRGLWLYRLCCISVLLRSGWCRSVRLFCLLRLGFCRCSFLGILFPKKIFQVLIDGFCRSICFHSDTGLQFRWKRLFCLVFCR